ncbi:MFS transporter [Streptosporangiaceae bacterium NEAU-GS5]|nr:MFS transporter [Streptosporangiaceae bacterium NEAU-GS5]
MRALRNHEFRILLASLVASVTGDQLFPVAVTIAVLNAHGSATTVGLVLAARWAALVIFSLFGGVWADRVPRRAVMLVAQGGQCLVIATGLLNPESTQLLGMMVFLTGAGEAFYRPAFLACLGAVLNPAERPTGAALNAVAWRLGAIAGPGLGALLVSATSPRVGFLAALIALALSFVTLLRLREPVIHPDVRRSAVREMADGFTEVWRHRWIGTVILVSAAQTMLTIAPAAVVLPLVSRVQFGGDTVYGTALSLLSVGGLIGALVSLRWHPRKRGMVGMAGLALYGLVPLALNWTGLIYIAYPLAGFGLEIYAVQAVLGTQAEIPPSRLARVISVDWLTQSMFTPLGLALTGPAIGEWGLTPVLMLAALAGFTPPLLALLVPGVTAFRGLSGRPPVRVRAGQSLQA